MLDACVPLCECSQTVPLCEWDPAKRHQAVHMCEAPENDPGLSHYSRGPLESPTGLELVCWCPWPSVREGRGWTLQEAAL